nr:U32 family peptidase [uncultured Holophaga sp.]
MGLELLAPARNAEQGILALRCGADAIYMGGARFGARQAVGNDAAAFAELTREARLWGAKVYATLNTVLFDSELEEARRQAWALFEAGVDAFIIQDMAWLELDLPPLPLHASTQAACDSPEKVAFLASAGLSRAILARELSLDEIRAIHQAADIELEAFVYGALCVGESGHCYLSGSICGRSGNRGECAQPCRSTWTLLDASGKPLIKERHLLNIKDLDLSEHLESLADTGVCSFKIEGRLKDADYVKNVVSHLRRRMDALLKRRPEFGRASLGTVSHGFSPDPAKTFQRGLSDYRIEGRRQSMGILEGGRHLGEPVGTVMSVKADRLVLDAPADLHPGDGLAFTEGGRMAGTVVNAVEGRQVFVQDPSKIRPGTRLHRNLDHAWLKALRGAKVERRISLSAILDCSGTEVRLRLQDPTGLQAEATLEGPFEGPKDEGANATAQREALGRLGGTPFSLEDLSIQGSVFIPVARLNALRREATAALEALRVAPHPREERRAVTQLGPLPETGLGFTWNIANRAARAFYEKAGGQVLEGAAELQADLTGRVLMTTRHCLRFEMGWCAVHPNPDPWKRMAEPKGPLFIENGATRLECRFDCARCRMELVLCSRKSS